MKTKWNDAMIAQELLLMAKALGRMPSSSEMRLSGRNDLSCAISRSGGFVSWAKRIGLSHDMKDTGFGKSGESMFVDMCKKNGLNPILMPSFKSPYDVLIDGCVKIDVKCARFAKYGKNYYSSGWFFRIGKHVQSDVVALVLFEEGNAIILPWWLCPNSNITITKNGKYKDYLNRWDIIKEMLEVRKKEMAKWNLT